MPETHTFITAFPHHSYMVYLELHIRYGCIKSLQPLQLTTKSLDKIQKVSLERKRRDSALTNCREIERNWLPFALSVVTHRTWSKGITLAFCFTMRPVYTHFPISIVIQNNGSLVKISNFLGENVSTGFRWGQALLLQYLKCQKNMLIPEGNDIKLVSDSAALIQQAPTVKNTDIRKILDSIYVSEKGCSGGWWLRPKLSSYKNSKVLDDSCLWCFKDTINALCQKKKKVHKQLFTLWMGQAHFLLHWPQVGGPGHFVLGRVEVIHWLPPLSTWFLCRLESFWP